MSETTHSPRPHTGREPNEIEKLGMIQEELSARFFERDEIIRGALAAMLAGEHVLLLGPVGTAKSMMAVELCRRIVGGRYFGWLLTKFSTPEELFGTISVRALQEDRYERVTAGKLPTAHIAFLDEIFKANSAILNSLLSLINERVFHNGQKAEPVPLITLFAASNELPEEGELLALFDRFMLRYTVNYIEEDFRFLRMLAMEDKPARTTCLSLTELHHLQERVSKIAIDQELLADLVDLRRRLNAKGIVASDRRYRRALGILRAFALIDGRSKVEPGDLDELANILWNDPAELDEVRLTIQQVFVGHEDKARELLFQAREVRDYAFRAWDDVEMAMRAGIEAHTKLKRIHSAIVTLAAEARDKNRRASEIDRILTEVEAIQREILAEGI